MDHIFAMIAIIYCKNLIILKNIAIVHVKKSVYRIYFPYMNKREAKILMTNSNLVDKKSAL